MKPHLVVFAILIVGYIGYNLFFKVADDKINTIINIVYASLIFGYISFMAFSVLKKMKK
ncbi:hypothetical protein [Chryseobacterium sp.]|uniref:hypothetical protein n=1 Tax=Chryseobacterium sp. TaxID=1871047 RepID=UPI00388E841B